MRIWITSLYLLKNTGNSGNQFLQYEQQKSGIKVFKNLKTLRTNFCDFIYMFPSTKDIYGYWRKKSCDENNLSFEEEVIKLGKSFRHVNKLIRFYELASQYPLVLISSAGILERTQFHTKFVAKLKDNTELQTKLKSEPKETDLDIN